MTTRQRLDEIKEIIEAVDDRAMAADGPVTPTLQEMTQEEISRIYALATLENPLSPAGVSRKADTTTLENKE